MALGWDTSQGERAVSGVGWSTRVGKVRLRVCGLSWDINFQLARWRKA